MTKRDQRAWIVLGVVLGAVALGLAAALLSAPRYGEIRGRVTVNGEPLDQGTITIRNTASGRSAAAEVRTCRFQIKKAAKLPPGPAIVQVLAYRGTGENVQAPGSLGRNAIAGVDTATEPTRLMEEREQFLPPQFNTKSQLKVALKAVAANDVDFQLLIK